jgi:hypothetical protein
MAAAGISPGDPAPLSEPQRLGNIFFAPSKTFIDIRKNASWWVPWVILSIVALLFTFAVGQKVGWNQIVQNEIAKNPRAVEAFDKMPPEQRDRQMELQGKISQYISYGSPVIIVIALVVVAGVMMATFNFGMGAEIKFGQSMAIVAYTWLVSIVGTVLSIVTLYAGVDPEGFNVRNPVATNLGHFVSQTSNKFLYGMASAVDIIAIWMIVLLGIGYASNSKIKTGTAIGVVAGWYIVYKLVGSGFSAMF